MGKSIKTGIAAAMCLALVGCHEYDFTPISDGEAAYQNYENVFIEKYGEPAPDQTWGFGSTEENANSTATKAITRAMTSSYTFPGDADTGKFLDAVPEGVDLGASFGSGIGYIDETYTGDVNIWGVWDNGPVGSTLYIKGNNDFSNRYFFVYRSSEIYLLKGATLTLSANNAANLQSNCKIYIAEGATLKTDGELKLNSAAIYNHGTIEAATISANGSALLYNGTAGIVTVTGAVNFTNYESVLVNDGTLTGASLNTAGSSKVQNNGTATISGETKINSNNNAWVNNGQYTTGSFAYTAGSYDVINKCKLTVNGEFLINLGDCANDKGFFMDGGSSVVAKTFKAEGPFYIHMGGNSVFEVTETAMFDASKADYGVYGIGTDYAVFHANKIEKGKDNQGYEVTYGGSLYVVANTTHFENGLSGTYPYIDFKNGCSEANIYQSGKTPHITIPTTECNPGFSGDSRVAPTPRRIIAEDLPASAGDFDFNDVVFDVQLNYPVTGKHTITLQAAGGTMPLYIGNVSGTEIEFANGQQNKAGDYFEVHKAFGVETGKMVNTAEWTATKEPVTIVIDGTYNDENDIDIRVKKGKDLPLLTAEKGKPASKIAVPVTYKWCKELKNIEDVYGDNFKNYVQHPTDYPDWYEPTPTTDVYDK